MSKPTPPRKPQKDVSEPIPVVSPAHKPNAKPGPGSKAKHPPKPAQQSDLDMTWQPCCDYRELIYSGQLQRKEIIYRGERVGWNGNREFIYFNPVANQEFHLYRPVHW